MFSELQHHRAIAWDFDGVLIDHTLSMAFHCFIRENPFGQEHHVVSFRRGERALSIERDLSALYPGHGVMRFATITTLPDQIFENAERFWPSRGLLECQEPAVVEYLTWKATVAVGVGASLLVDDMRDHVIRGCAQTGVAYAHPGDFMASDEIQIKNGEIFLSI